MEAYMSRLMSAYSATTFVIIRDDATIAENHRAEFSAVDSSKDVSRKRPSFKNCPTKNSAPKLPARKTSSDDLSLLPNSLNPLIRKSGSRRRRRSSMDDELLSHGMKNIGRHSLPSLAEGSRGPSPRRVLFQDIFRDLDVLLQNTSLKWETTSREYQSDDLVTDRHRRTRRLQSPSARYSSRPSDIGGLNVVIWLFLP